MLMVNKPKHNSILERYSRITYANINGKRDHHKQSHRGKL